MYLQQQVLTLFFLQDLDPAITEKLVLADTSAEELVDDSSSNTLLNISMHGWVGIGVAACTVGILGCCG